MRDEDEQYVREREELHKQRRSVVHVTTIPFTLWVFLRGHVRFQEQCGFSVHAITSGGAYFAEFARDTGIPVHRVDMKRSIAIGSDIEVLTRLTVLLRELRPSIVHAHTPKAGFLGMLAAHLAHVPVKVYHLHGLRYATMTGLRRALALWSETASCTLADRVLGVGDSLRRAAIEDSVCESGRIRVLGQGSIAGVDASGRFNPVRFGDRARREVRQRVGVPTDAPVVGFVGRIVRDKGIEVLAEAWERVRSRVPAAHLVLVGPVEAQDSVTPRALQRLREDPHVRFRGVLADPSSTYAAMDLVVLPTYREGFPIVPLEAAAMGIPVVASRVVGCVDAVEDGVTGKLVPVGDPVSLASAILDYLSDRNLRLDHGAAGRRRVEARFRPEMLYRAVCNEYLELLGVRGKTVAP